MSDHTCLLTPDRYRAVFHCPVCGRLPKIIKSVTQTGDDIQSIYRLQCPRKHISTSWYGDLQKQASSGDKS